MEVKVEVTIKNIGHSVATNIRNIMSADLPARAGKDPLMQPIKDQKEMCDTWREVESRPNSPHSSTVLFPDQTFTEDTSLKFTKAQLDQARIIPNRPTPVDYVTSVIVIGCIDYTFVFASEHHQTGYIMEMFKPTPQNFGSLSIRIGENVPPSQLAIRPFLFGGSYVD
jgi:hypothetical protein